MRGEGAIVLGVDLDRVIPLRSLEGMNLFHVERVGHQLDDGREDGGHAHVELTGDAEEREQLHPLHGLLHGGDRVFARDLTALEVALQQGIVGGGDRLDQLLVVLVEGGLEFRRNVGLLELA
jgi:hypothetical protein